MSKYHFSDFIEAMYFLDMIADETAGATEDEALEFMEKVGHPALAMDPMI